MFEKNERIHSSYDIIYYIYILHYILIYYICIIYYIRHSPGSSPYGRLETKTKNGATGNFIQETFPDVLYFEGKLLKNSIYLCILQYYLCILLYYLCILRIMTTLSPWL